MRRTLATALTMLLLPVSLVACASAGTAGPAGSVAATPPGAPSLLPAGMGSDAADGVFPRTLGTFGGTVTIESPPTRVVAISTGQLDGLLTLGILPVGSTTAKGAALIPEYVRTAFPDRADALAAIASVGSRTDPDVEAVAAAEPDLILTNSTVDAAVRAKFAQLAPTVVTQGTGVNWKQDFLLLADAVGKREAATQLLTDFRTDAQALGTKAGSARTVSLLSLSPDRIRVFGIGSFAGSILADADLPRPPSQRFAETSKDVSVETLDAAAGDWIFYGAQGADNAVLSSTVWTSLPAVTAGRAKAVDYDVWYLNAGPAAARLVLVDLTSALAG